MVAHEKTSALRHLRRAAAASSKVRSLHGASAAPESGAYLSLQEHPPDTVEHSMLTIAHRLAMESMDGLERTCSALDGLYTDTRAGLPIIFLLRPAAELAARVFAICAPELTVRQRMDSASAQFRYSARQKEKTIRFLQAGDAGSGRRIATQTVAFERQLEAYESGQPGPNDRKGNPSSLSGGLMKDPEVFEMLREFFAADDAIGELNLETLALGRRDINAQFAHTDPILVANFLGGLSDDGGFSERDAIGVGFLFAEYLLIGSVAASTYFGWDNDWYTATTVRCFNEIAAEIHKP